MNSSNNSSSSTSSTNASSERIYDFEYMMKLAGSSASAMSSTSTLAQLNLDEDVSEIVKLSPTKSQFEDNVHDNYMWDGSSDYASDSESDEDEYGSWYDIRTDLSDEQIEELRNAVYDAISLELPLSPVDEDVQLSFTAPVQEPQQQSQQSQQYPAPIVQWQTTRAKSNYGFIPPVQFQSRAFAGLATRRQSQFTQRQSQLGANFSSFARQRTAAIPANTFNTSNPSNAFNWRREAPQYPTRPTATATNTRNNGPLRPSWSNANPNVNVNTNAVSSWRKTQPGLEWKYNEESNGYKLIKV